MGEAAEGGLSTSSVPASHGRACRASLQKCQLCLELCLAFHSGKRVRAHTAQRLPAARLHCAILCTAYLYRTTQQEVQEEFCFPCIWKPTAFGSVL